MQAVAELQVVVVLVFFDEKMSMVSGVCVVNSAVSHQNESRGVVARLTYLQTAVGGFGADLHKVIRLHEVSVFVLEQGPIDAIGELGERAAAYERAALGSERVGQFVCET